MKTLDGRKKIQINIVFTLRYVETAPMVQDFPQEVCAEIIAIMQLLKASWPSCRTILHDDDGPASDGMDRYLIAVQWLTDRGFVSFEAMMLDARGLSVIHAGLTSSGHEYARALASDPVEAAPISLPIRE